MNGVCPYCEAKREVEIVNKVVGFKLDKNAEPIKMIYTTCLTCKGQFATNEQMEESLKGWDND